MADGDIGIENEDDLWAAAAEDLQKQKEMLRDASAGGGGGGGAQEAPSAVMEPAQADPMADIPRAASRSAAGPAPSGDIQRILDIPLQVTVELGRTKMLINDLLQLGQGSVIELTKLVGEPLDFLVNEKAVAKGEVVVINEKFGVRLTEIIGPLERIETLG